MAALEEILQRHPVWRGGALSRAAPALSSGFAELDRELPGGGWPTGALTELLVDRRGIGELQLVLPALAAISWEGQRIVWLAPEHLPYAPALASAGIDLAQLVVVRTQQKKDALWAAEQVLRSGSCKALLAWFSGTRYEELQRLAIATEASRACTLVFRPLREGQTPSPACLRIALAPGSEALRVHILKRRGPPAAAALHVKVERPVHALGRIPFPDVAAGRHARDARRLGLPVHA